MIEEYAVVTRYDGDGVLVEAQRRSSCSGCSASSGCGTAALSRVLGVRNPVMRVANPLGVRPGDAVIIGLHNSTLTRLSVIAYGVPLLAMIVAALAASQGGGYLHPALAEPAAILGGLGGLAAGFYWLAQRTRQWQSDPRYQAVLLRRVLREQPVPFYPPPPPSCPTAEHPPSAAINHKEVSL